MKRLGIRKGLLKFGETKIAKAIDVAISFPIVKIEGALNYVAKKSGLNKLKIVTGKNAKIKKNADMNSKIEQIKRNTVMQEAKDIVSAKEFEREKESEGIEVNVLDYGTRRGKGVGTVLKNDIQREGMCVKMKLSDIKEKQSLQEGSSL